MAKCDMDIFYFKWKKKISSEFTAPPGSEIVAMYSTVTPNGEK